MSGRFRSSVEYQDCAKAFAFVATNAQTAGTSVTGAQAALSDLGTQISNMTSQAGTAAKNAMATSSTAATITASFKQLQAAQAYNTAARADIQSIVQTLGIK